MRLHNISVNNTGIPFRVLFKFKKPNGLIVKETAYFMPDMDEKQVKLILQGLVKNLEGGE